MNSAAAATFFELAPAERAALDRDGYILRENVFTRDECAAMADECEKMVAALTAAKGRNKVRVGSYMFERCDEMATIVKWEPFAPDLVQGVEPFAHFWTPLRDWALDPRLVDPCKAICDAGELVLFTEKLNLKRARQGGAIVLHQDFPYWEPFAPQANRVATAMVFLDDSDVHNGTLQVAAGTHRQGKWPQRTDSDGFGSLEMDPTKFDAARLRPLQVGAGAVAYFGAFLVHQSLPNTSNDDRRALLYSYQPAGNPHSREMLNWPRRAAADAERATQSA